MTPEAMIAAVRDLHRPVNVAWPECSGCDSEGWESEAADWPCRTAGIVYTIAEINAVGRAAQEAREADRARRAAKPSSPTQSLIPSVWAQQLLAQLSAGPLTQVILNQPRQT